MDNALRKQIMTESLGYPDLIQKDFLEKSRLDFDREAVKNLNEAVVKDLNSLRKDFSGSFVNIKKLNKNLGVKLALQAASLAVK